MGAEFDGSGRQGASALLGPWPGGPWPGREDRTSLIGRDVDLLTLAARLRHATDRLITLTGPAGVGKSRLAAAAVAQAGLPHVCVVDLHDATEERQLRSRVDEALTARPGREETLLLLDGIDHVADPAAAAAESLLARLPGLRILATGRRGLWTYGERLYEVQPLSTPVPPYRQDPAELQNYAVVALFLDRARAVQPSFTLTPHNARAVAEICARLDGLPLAIELIADRLRLFRVETLLQRLRLGHPVLGGRHSARSPHHRSAAALTEHSFSLLDEEHRRLLTRLAVFTGSVSLDTLESFWEMPSLPTEQAVETLVAHHLLWVSPEGEEPRFTLFNTVREFCLERLERSGELGWARRRHAEHFLGFVLGASRHLTGPRQERWLGLIALEHDGVHTALSHLEKSGRRTEAALASVSLERYWLVRGHLALGERWLGEAAASLLDDPRHRAQAPRAELARGRIAMAAGDVRLAADCFHRAAVAFHDQGDATRSAAALAHLATAQRDAGPAETRAAATRLLRAAGDGEPHPDLARALLATAGHGWRTDAKIAAELLDAADGQYTRLQDARGQGEVLALRGHLAAERGDADLGERLLWEALHRLRPIGEHTLLPEVLESRARLLWERLPEQGHRVARLLAAAASLREATGVSPLGVCPPGRNGAPALLRRLRTMLSGAEYEADRRAGRQMSAEAAATEALAVPPPAAEPCPATSRTVQLTARQYEVALLVSHGMTNRQIARHLDLSEWTVVNHVRQIMRRLDASSRIHIAQWVLHRERQNGTGSQRR
ncbi:ATP-binding protein [Streptomyces sp. 4N509B]|uniref:ATP-binding protein n=1 Tax=Streptomyces sp. 4N509B TaxID=3457413 RepID=UPI003FD06543